MDTPRTSERTTVLFMLDVFMELAGSERNLHEIVTRLDRKKFIPVVACLRCGAAGERLAASGIEVIDLNLGRIYGPSGLACAARMWQMLRERKVKIVVTYHESSDFLGSVIARFAGVPVVVSSRRDMGYSLRGRHIAVYRVVNRLFDRVITVSEAVRDVIARSQGLPWHKMVTIYNGVELEKFALPDDARTTASVREVRASFGIAPDEPVVGIPAALRPVKGHQYFLEAAALVAREHPRARFLVVGWPFDDAYQEELKAMTGRLSISDRVIFAGGRRDMPLVLAAMDIAVFSSLNEGFSNAVVESMAAGKPVVATDSGGTAEAVADGISGLLVPPKDPEALARSITRLLDDPARARAMGEKGREIVRERFTMETMIRETESLFETLLAEKGAAGGTSLTSRGSRMRRFLSRTSKQFFGATLYYSGRLRTHATDGTALILAYHRVSDERFVFPGMAIRPGHFEQQMRFLREHFNLLSLDRLAALLASGGTVPPRTVVVTFDDGYRDNYLNAFPVLRRYGIPATIFLSVGAIEDGGMLWFDAVSEIFRMTDAREADLRRLGAGRYRLGSARERLSAAVKVAAWAKKISVQERTRLVSALQAELGPGPGPGRRLMMRWDEVRAMHRAGITFGSHGISHTPHAFLSREELDREIGESRRIIRERSGIDVLHFAFPNGGGEDLNPLSAELLRKHGYVTASTLLKGFNRPGGDPLLLKRVCVTEGMEVNVFGMFSKPVFAAELSGVSPRSVIGRVFSKFSSAQSG